MDAQPVKRVIMFVSEVIALLSDPDTERRQRLEQALLRFRAQGYTIMLSTSLPMDASSCVTATSLRELADTLEESGATYDELCLTDPQADSAHLIVDDRIVTMQEFLELSPDEVTRLLGAEDGQG